MRLPDFAVSGGQTGVDRAWLDTAEILGVEWGKSYCPKGRLSEDGIIPYKYNNFIETRSKDYLPRTVLNVIHTDATLILVKEPGSFTPGSQRTLSFAKQLRKPVKVVFLNSLDCPIGHVQGWLEEVMAPVPEGIFSLNVAGSRESKSPGIYQRAKDFLLEVLK